MLEFHYSFRRTRVRDCNNLKRKLNYTSLYEIVHSSIAINNKTKRLYYVYISIQYRVEHTTKTFSSVVPYIQLLDDRGLNSSGCAVFHFNLRTGVVVHFNVFG